MPNERFVNAEPYRWPYDGSLRPQTTALVVIDMQTDFCGKGGYVDVMGYDLSLTQAPIAPIRRLLDVLRPLGYPIIHTREGHRPDLSDLYPAKRDRGNPSLRIGDDGPMGRLLVRGSAGHEIVPELAPVEGEVVLDKPGKDAFYATDLEAILRASGVTHLVVTGVTTEVCVQTTVRAANDRGFECLVLSDCTGSYFPEFHQSALAMFAAQGGIVGWVGTSADLLDAISASDETRKA